MRTESATKADVAKMVSKEDLKSLQSSLLKETKGLVADAVQPLKTDIIELRARMDAQEKRPAQTQLASSSTMSPAVKQLIDGLDPAHRRISLSGFPEKVPASERFEHIDKLFNFKWD
jgi:hypothetical protein